MSEETKVEDLDLVEDVTEVQLHDEDLVEDVEVETEETIAEDAEEIVAEDVEVVEEETEETLEEAAATAEVPKTKAGIINAMYKEMSKMKKEQLQAAYEGMMGSDDDEEEDKEEDDEVEESKSKVKESYDFQADLEALVSSDDLSEEFQGKAATIFEAAVKD